MAVTDVFYTGNGATTIYTIPFSYIDESDVFVSVNGFVVTNYIFASSSTIQFAAAPTNGAQIRIYRQTANDNLIANFFAGSSIRATDLNNNFFQTLYSVQEVINRALNKIGDTMQGILNMGGYKITNLGTPSAATDAATKNYIDNLIAAATIADADYGDITVSNGASIWTIDNGAVTNAKVAASAGIDASKLAFLQSGTGAATRTVDSKLKDVVSVKDFGAVGDNTTDATAAIAAVRTAFPNTSIDLAGASYRVTTIPAGWGFRNGLLTLDPANTDDQPANEAYGYGALAANTYIPLQHPAGGGIDYASGNFNTAFGNYALGANTTGRRQTAIGSQALRLNTSGFYNTAVGSFALYTNVIGNYNTALGNQALQFSTGSNNAAVGSGALTSLTIGDDNIAVGDRAMGISAQVNRTIAIGTQAGQQHTGNDSIAIGYQALSAPASSGLYNVAIGSASLGSATTANSNVAVGRRSAAALTTGVGNTAVGTDAMVGSGLPCTGSNNTAIGNTASPNITTGYQNVAVGVSSGSALTEGFNNVFIGRFAAQLNTTGSGNVAIGEQSLSAVTTGNYNTAVGTGTVGNATDTNTTMLGYQATVTGSNQVQLGNSSTTTYVYGTVQNRSDARDKADIQDTILGLEFVNALRPVDFRWDYREDYEAEKDGSKKRTRFHHGLIAQEVKQVCDGLGIDFGGYQDHTIAGGKDVLTIGYDELIAPLIKAVQQLSAEVEHLKAQLS